MKVELLPSGSYRVRKQINRKTISVVFDHEPSDVEILRALAEKAEALPAKGSFHSHADKYFASKNHVISPSTLAGYMSNLRSIPEWFKNKDISAITQADIQNMVNEYAANHAPKSVANIHGLVSGILKQYRPGMIINTTLPQKVQFEGHIPTEEEVEKILEASKDDQRYHIVFQLGIMGLRRSEVAALQMSDVDTENNILTIDKAKVKGPDNKWFIKTTKTEKSARKIYIPAPLVEEIVAKGEIFNGNPNTILVALNRYQDRLGIPRFRLHDMRVFFCSYSHYLGMTDQNIMATGGWSSPYTMQRVYRHEMKAKEAQAEVFDRLIGKKVVTELS